MTITQRPAGFWIRFVASIIDGVILMLITTPASLFFGKIVTLLGGGILVTVFSMIVQLGFSLFASVAYYVHFYQKNGATPGKKWLGIKVVQYPSGELLLTKQIIYREFLGKTLSALTLMIGYLMAGIRSDKRALHDLVGDSQVVHDAP